MCINIPLSLKLRYHCTFHLSNWRSLVFLLLSTHLGISNLPSFSPNSCISHKCQSLYLRKIHQPCNILQFQSPKTGSYLFLPLPPSSSCLFPPWCRSSLSLVFWSMQLALTIYLCCCMTIYLFNMSLIFLWSSLLFSPFPL